MSLRRKIFYGFTLSLIAILLALPATGWLVRLQLFPFTIPHAIGSLYQGNTTEKRRLERDYQKFLSHNPNDFEAQYAHDTSLAFYDNAFEMNQQALEKLNEKYPQHPEIWEAILKNATRDILVNHRKEQDLLEPPSRQGYRVKVASLAKKEIVAKFVQIAEQGEKQEPNNAFFPVLAAHAYFCAGEDDKAVVAWLHAGEKTQWNDHSREEIYARWHLQEVLTNDGGEAGAIARMVAMGNLLFPHTAALRSAGRMAIATAVTAELQGDKEKGFLLRRATRSIGQNMEANSSTYISGLVGQAIVQLAETRPGGAPKAENPYKGAERTTRWNKEEADRYTQYLSSIGHPEESPAFTHALDQGAKLRTLWNAGNEKTYFGIGPKTMQLFTIWACDQFLITGIFFSLVFAGIFKMVYRFSPRLQKGEPLSHSAKWGLINGVLLSLLAGVVYLSQIGKWMNRLPTFELAALVCVVILAVSAFLLRFQKQDIAHGFIVIGATIVSLAALLGTGTVCAFFANHITNGYLLMNTTPYSDDQIQQQVDGILTQAIIGFLVLCVPLSLLALFAVFSKILRVPLAAGITRGMRAMAVPFACFLILVWSGTFFYTWKHETAAIHEMQQIATIGEAQYIAKLIGTPPIR